MKGLRSKRQCSICAGFMYIKTTVINYIYPQDEGLDDIDHEDNVKKTTQEEPEDEDSDMSRVKKAVSASAAMAAAWAQLYQGKDLHELTLDPFTCSEILRLHFLSSGASLGECNFQDRLVRRYFN